MTTSSWPPQLADVARLIGEPARLRMLWALGDGRAYTATELANAAGLSPSAASNHLARLVDAGVLEVRRQGRHRYVALAREDVGRAVEALAAVQLGPAPGRPSLPSPRPALRHARRCYGHLAGECGVALWDAAAGAACWLSESAPAPAPAAAATGTGAETSNAGEGRWHLSELGARRLGLLGVDGVRAGDEVRPCLDWTERRWHLGGPLGRAVLEALRHRGVVSPSPAADRVLLVDPHRWRSVMAEIGARSAATGP